MTALDLQGAAQVHEIPILVPDHLKVSAMATWRGRMINEYQSAKVFDGLAEHMAMAGFPQKTIDECKAFAAEERRHGALCGAVVQSMGGKALASVEETEAYPFHDDVFPLEGVFRNVLSICCLSETIAVALIGAERLEMPEGPLRKLLTEIYADECGHSNFGWRLLRSALPDDAEMKARLGEYLKVAFAHLEAHELAHLPLNSVAGEGGEAYGLCSGAQAQALFYAAVAEIIIPGLEALGIPAQNAWDTRDKSRFLDDSETVQRVEGVRAAALEQH